MTRPVESRSPFDHGHFVVADTHGRLDLIHGLLTKAGIWDPERGKRHLGAIVVHLGDLANCVSGSIESDIACLTAARDLFDVVLIGNHEHPYFGGTAFAGFWRDMAVENAIHKLDWQPSLAVGEFLLTHAGLTLAMNTPHPDSTEEAPWQTAEIADDELRWAWKTDPTFPVFNAVSCHRGGWNETGGILWADWSEHKTTAGMSQIVGHTPGPIRVQGQEGHAKLTDGRPRGLEADEPFVMCIDIGAAKGTGGWPDGDALAGCWIRDGKVEVTIYSSKGEEIEDAA